MNTSPEVNAMMVPKKRKISLVVNDNADLSYMHSIPYTSNVPRELSRKYIALLEHIHNHSELYQSQIAQNMIIEYAESRFDAATIKKVFDSVEPQICINYFDQERQIALFRSALSNHEVLEIMSVIDSTDQLSVPLDVVTSLRKVVTLCTESYYDAMDGFFPWDFLSVEGCHIDSVAASVENEKVLCDADSDYTRQLSILINIGNTLLHFTPVSLDDTITLKPGDTLLYPSNYSCSYRLRSEGVDGVVAKLYRLSTDDSQK